MNSPASPFGPLPAGLRDPLLTEYRTIVQNYLERRWTSASLSGGKFCEIVYTIVDGFGTGTYAASPSKPGNMVDACKALEKRGHVPRSFQILIPRLLPALYEVRNQRGVGHVRGDVDSNHMDCVAVLGIANWIMAELVRVLHTTTTDEAQQMVEALSMRRIPLVWDGPQGMKRVLDPKVPLKDQVLLLSSASARAVTVAELLLWTGYKNANYFRRLVRGLAAARMVELSADGTQVTILPPGSVRVDAVVKEYQLHFAS